MLPCSNYLLLKLINSLRALLELAGVHRNYIELNESAEPDREISSINKIAKTLKVKISKLVDG